MFRQVKPESRRELTLLARPRDHDIFNTRTIQPVTDKLLTENMKINLLQDIKKFLLEKDI